jgi:hypothetical protein
MSAPERTNFEIQHAFEDAEGKYQLEERAAIHEFEGRLNRMEAERRAWVEVMREKQCRRE